MLPPLVQAQDTVPLKLQDQSGTLLKGTQVLVLREEGDEAQSLNARGIGRDEIRRRLLDRAKEEPAALLDTLGTGGTTKGRYPTGDLHYLLARTPDGTLYESQVYYNSSQPDKPGFDLVVSGDMTMASVPDGANLVNVFEKVLKAAATAQLTLNKKGGSALPKQTKVRIWARGGSQSQSKPDRSFLQTPADSKVRLNSKGMTKRRFGRTWHADSVLYAAARAPDGTVYETAGGFEQVEAGEMKMVRPSGKRRKAVGAVFESPSFWDRTYDKLAGWEGWLVFWLLGIVSGLAGAIWWYEEMIRKEEKKKESLKAKLRERRREDSNMTLRSTSPTNSDEPETRRENTVEEVRAKNDELRQEIEALKEKVRKRNQKLRELKEEDRSSPDSPQPPPQPSQPSSEPTSSSPSPPPQNPTREKTGETFTEWCTSENPTMVSKYQLFKPEVEEAVPDASFRRITREKNAAGLVFDDDAQDPVEYWLVEAGGKHFLLPQPSRDRFRELGECFDGPNKAPSEVSAVQPALLKRKGGQLMLEEKGQIT